MRFASSSPKEQVCGPVRNLLLAWVLTLPAAILLSASLYILFASIL